ncbi:DUF1206 domain-containing protein [Novosphingobium sp. KCTC 2891]|uniref:DUF1206 domain-containing protein n=1 Tax=Novosphingobium sp. KCTC 2891 TaxID=2989730 RepID=UPI0022213DF0|nr:DUF1206 domain-containing protein [Novosphingobium sp. KCTC 2891]MCW1381829.1 DUF1206 domain-containing protein [Novosphingobium sp. KCTC 2891]
MAKLTRIDVLARAGYAARAAVYLLLGYVALATRGAAKDGPNAVFAMMQDMPLGGAALALIVAGLLAYGIYKLAAALLDIEHHGHDAKGAAVRTGLGAGALAYLSMAWAAGSFALGYRHYASEGGNGSAAMASGVLSLPLGWVLLALVGAAFLGAAAFQAINAATGKFMKRIAADAPRPTEMLGRIGFAARTVVFALVGWSLLRSAWMVRHDQVRDLGGVLAQLRGEETLYLAVAGGLVVFGLFSVICARFRIVPAIDVVHAARGKVRRKTEALRRAI